MSLLCYSYLTIVTKAQNLNMVTHFFFCFPYDSDSAFPATAPQAAVIRSRIQKHKQSILPVVDVIT